MRRPGTRARGSSRVAGGIAAVALIALGTGSAHAQDKKAGDALFREGRAAFDKGDYPTACAKFEASQAADPALGTLLNLAVCEEKVGKLVASRNHLIELLFKATKKDDRAKFAEELSAKLEARIPTLTLTLAPDAPTDTKARDAQGGAPLEIGKPVPFDPGAHEIVVTAAGRPDARLSVNLAEGARETRQIAPGAVVVVEQPGPPPDEGASGRKLRRNLAYAAGGVGVAGLGVAIVTGLVLESKKSELDKHCPNKQCDATGVKLLAEDKSTPLVAVNMVGWIAGIAGLGAGTVLFLTSRAPAGPADEGRPPAPSARLMPVLAPGYGGLSLDAKF
jgi:hypothetical protein